MVVTRFVSQSRTPVGQGAMMDPNAASAAQRAAAQGAGQIAQSMMGALASFKVAEEKPDELYLAQAKGDFQVEYNDTFMRSAAQIQPNQDFPSQVPEMFNQAAAKYIENAPNKATAEALQRSFISMQSSSVQRAQRAQFGIDQDYLAQGFTDFAVRSGGLIAAGQAGEEATYANLEERASAAIAKGYSTTKIQDALSKAKEQVYMQARLSDIQKNPFEMLKAIDSGAFASLGIEKQNILKRTAENNIGGQYQALTSAITDVKKAAEAGVNLSDVDIQVLKQSADLVTNYVPSSMAGKAAALGQQLSEVQQLAEFNEGVKTLSPEQLDVVKAKIQERHSAGEISTASYQSQDRLLQNRKNRILEDGLSHYISNNPQELPVEFPGTQASPEEKQAFIANRTMLADRAEAYLGIPVPPTRQAEIKGLVSQWENYTYDEQKEALQTLAAFGPKYTNRIANVITKQEDDLGGKSASSKTKALPQILRMMSVSDDTVGMSYADQAIKGMDVLNKKQVSFTNENIEEINTAANNALGRVFQGNPGRRAEIVETAKAILAQRAYESGGEVEVGGTRPWFGSPTEGIEDIVKGIVGIGTMSGPNGGNEIMPRRDVTSLDIERYARPWPYGLRTADENSLTDLEIHKFGNGTPVILSQDGEKHVPLTVEDFNDYDYIYAGDGKYFLRRGNSTVAAADPKDISKTLGAYLFDLKSLFDTKKPLTNAR